MNISSINLVSQSLKEFLSEKSPPRGTIISPIIPERGLVMFHAVRGIGKTQVSLSIALSVAAGQSTLDGRFKCDRPRIFMLTLLRQLTHHQLRIISSSKTTKLRWIFRLQLLELNN